MSVWRACYDDDAIAENTHVASFLMNGWRDALDGGAAR